MRTVTILVTGVLVAVVCSGIGYSVGMRSGYSDGYTEGRHDSCVRVRADEQEVLRAIAAIPNVDPKAAQAVVTTVAIIQSDACSS